MDLVRAEGEVRVTVHGLPTTPGLHYVVWLGRDGSPDTYRLGELTPEATDSGTLNVLYPNPIPDKGWNLALITAEDSATPKQPGPRHWLAGRFPKPLPPGTVPLGLPNTGEGGGSGATGVDGRVIWSGALIFGLGLGLFGIYRLRRS